jgi:hypothetical protein
MLIALTHFFFFPEQRFVAKRVDRAGQDFSTCGSRSETFGRLRLCFPSDATVVADRRRRYSYSSILLISLLFLTLFPILMNKTISDK